MKYVLILSDTHSNYDILQDVLDSNILADVIIHLGDNYDDLDQCVYNRRDREVYRVPGIFHPNYRDGSLARQLEITIEGKNFLIAHALDDIHGFADVILYGHTHNWEISNSINGVCFNPGHLRAPVDKRRIATYGQMEIRDTGITLKILNLQHKVIVEFRQEYSTRL